VSHTHGDGTGVTIADFAIDRTCWQSVFASKKPPTNKAGKMSGECDLLATVGDNRAKLAGSDK
jgi:hypothetical protein